MNSATTTHIAALSPDGQAVLEDPRLVEDFSDVLARRPAPHDEQSVSGSVVVTRDTPSAPTEAAPAASAPDMDYSDSEFEDNLEQRLRELDTGADNDAVSSGSAGSGSIHHRPSSDQLRMGHAALEFSDDDDEHAMFASDEPEEDEEEEEDDDDEDDDDYGEEEFLPLQPPQELDPDKLYALYAFNGPDTSHCQLEQDEACVLLNDQDAYWWLVKRCRDSKIGFAPAEILETFPERLARLNCWKNEDLSASKVGETDEVEADTPPLAQYKKNGPKSVSFNDIVTYADRFVAPESESDADHEHSPHDEYGNEALRYNDEASDTVSDVSFSTGYTQPLVYNKTRASPDNSPTDDITNDIQGLLQPSAPFSQARAGPAGRNAGSDLSVSTIGEFSPSTASEQTQDSPVAKEEENAHPHGTGLPASHAIQDISTLVHGSSDTSLSLSLSLGEESDASEVGEHTLVPKDTQHPAIASIYSPFFAQIDTLLGSLDAMLGES